MMPLVSVKAPRLSPSIHLERYVLDIRVSIRGRRVDVDEEEFKPRARVQVYILRRRRAASPAFDIPRI